MARRPKGKAWQKAALAAFERDGRLCRHCGKGRNDGLQMETHHIKPFKEFSYASDANHVDNLLTLCRSCHRKEEARIRAVKRAESRFAEFPG